MKKLSMRSKAITTTALVSMTDIIFLLLIFLLISSSFLSQTGIKIDLPTSKNPHLELQNKRITISIDRNGKYYLNNKEIADFTSLDLALKTELVNDPEAIVIINADKNRVLDDVVKLIDLAKGSGATRFFIAAELLR